MLKIKGTGNKGFTIIEMAIVSTVACMFFTMIFAIMFNATNSMVTDTEKLFDKLQLQKASKHFSTHIKKSSYTHIKDESEVIADSGPILELFNYDHILTGTYSKEAITGYLVFSDPVTGNITFESVICVFDVANKDGAKVTEVKVDYSSPYNSTAIIACGISTGDSWVKVFGGLDLGVTVSPDQRSWSLGRMRRTHDGGYIIVNGTNYFNIAEFWGYLLKIDRHGDKQWSKTFAPLTGIFGDTRFHIAETFEYNAVSGELEPDGYIVGIASDVRGGDLLRVDNTGAFLWHKRFTLGFPDPRQLNSVEQVFRMETAGGNHLEADGYILAGSFSSTEIMGSVIKTDVNGDRQWEKFIYADDTGAHTALSAIKQTFDSAGDPTGYIAIGTGKYVGPGSGDVYLVKLDNNGVHEWSSLFDRGNINRHDIGANILQTFDAAGNPSGYILSGASSWINYIIKTNVSGDHQWSKLFGNGVGIGVPFSIQEVTIPGGGYITAGYINPPHATSTDGSCYLIKTSIQGNIVTGGVDTGWARVFGGAEGSGAYSIEMAFTEKDKFDGYVFQGHSLSYGVGMPAGAIEGYIVKTDLHGHCPESENPERIDDPLDHLAPSFDISTPAPSAGSFDNPRVWIGSVNGVENYNTGLVGPLLTVNYTNSPRIAVNHMDKSLWISHNGVIATPDDSEIVHIDNDGNVDITILSLMEDIIDLAVVVNTERPDNNFCWFADRLPVTLPGSGVIRKFSPAGAEIVSVPAAYGINNGEVLRIAVNSRDGSLWYTDPANNRVVKLDANGIPDISGNFPIGLVPPSYPSGIDIDLNDGSCWVVDYRRSRVYKFNEDGSFALNLNIVNNLGDVSGDIAVNQKDGSVWVGDLNGGIGSIILLDSTGTIIGSIARGTALQFEFAPNPFKADRCFVLETTDENVLYVTRTTTGPNFLFITVPLTGLNTPISIGRDMGDYIETMQGGLLPDSDEVDTLSPPTGTPTWSEDGEPNNP